LKIASSPHLNSYVKKYASLPGKLRENLPEGMQREFFVETSHVSVQLLSFGKNSNNDTITISKKHKILGR
jgi:hypothetical protein